jgi:hypothetical protein
MESRICKEKLRLAKVYQEATDKFSGYVADLQKHIGKVPKAEFERLQRASEEARIHSEEARIALEQHVAAHKC